MPGYPTGPYRRHHHQLRREDEAILLPRIDGLGHSTPNTSRLYRTYNTCAFPHVSLPIRLAMGLQLISPPPIPVHSYHNHHRRPHDWPMAFRHSYSSHLYSSTALLASVATKVSVFGICPGAIQKQAHHDCRNRGFPSRLHRASRLWSSHRRGNQQREENVECQPPSHQFFPRSPGCGSLRS